MAGWSETLGMTMLGHQSPSQFATYVRQANRLHAADAAHDLMLTMRASLAGTAAEQELDTQRTKVDTPLSPVVQLRG